MDAYYIQGLQDALDRAFSEIMKRKDLTIEEKKEELDILLDAYEAILMEYKRQKNVNKT